MNRDGIRPYLRLLQTPAPTPRPASAARFDASRPAPQTDALRNVWWDGHGRGFQQGWLQGVRWGVFVGFCSTLCLATLLAGAAAGLGWL